MRRRRLPADHVDGSACFARARRSRRYCRCYTADLRPERIAEFLLLDPEFPRSVRFAAAARRSRASRAIAQLTGRGAGGRAERLAGRLHASLDYGQVDEILSDDPHGYLDGIGRQCAQIHAAHLSELHLLPHRDGASRLARGPCTTPSATSPASPTKRPSARASWKRACSRAARAASAASTSGSARRRRRASMMYQDHDGNIVHHFNIPGRHSRLDVTAEALVECARSRRLPERWDRRVGDARRA